MTESNDDKLECVCVFACCGEAWWLKGKADEGAKNARLNGFGGMAEASGSR